MRFSDLTEDQWEYIECYLPPQPRVGRKRAEDRRTINGILYILEASCKWDDMPRRYGSYVTAWRRLRRWSEEGVRFKILCAICDTAYNAGKLSVDTMAVDSTLIDSKGGESSRYNGHKRRRGMAKAWIQKYLNAP